MEDIEQYVALYEGYLNEVEKSGGVNKMKVWEVLQDKISKMKEKEFIEFIKKYCSIFAFYHIFGDDRFCCGKMKCSNSCAFCKEKILYSDYQETNKEEWIVHRTLRTQNIEVYISNVKDYYDTKVEYLVAHNCGDIFGGYGENIFSCKSKELA